MKKSKENRMAGYKEKAGNKRKPTKYYPLSNTSRYLMHLVNIVWQEFMTENFDVANVAGKPTTIAGLFKELNSKDMRKRYWLNRFPSPEALNFSVEALCEHWPRPLLETIFVLSLEAGNVRSLRKSTKERMNALLKALHPNTSPDKYVRLWYGERFSGMPFYLKYLNGSRTLAPDYDREDPVKTLWAWIATLLVEIDSRKDRLKVCEFDDPKLVGVCLNMFWDESKNKRKKYCDETDCKKARLRQKVSAWRKNRKTDHG
ncbi:MAG: CGNR zinc finger domain-containing protein [Nitrospirae bacterium]|nr:CGNR zinc finger domain-containing protein [Nitrospirota bacterium]